MSKGAIAGIYLAAGQSRRMGTDKRALPWEEGTLGAAGLKAALRSCLSPVIVVVPPADALAWLPDTLLGHDKCRLVRCADWHRGQAHSLACGLQEASAQGADAAAVLLADQPFVTTEVIDALAVLYRQHRPDYVAFSHSGTPMPPVIWGKQTFPSLLALEGDAGGRRLFRNPHWRGLLYEGSEPTGMDIDTKDDYERAVIYQKKRRDIPVAVGKSIIRKEAWDKVTGRAKYTNDFKEQGMLHAKLVTSPYAHARILSIETNAALAAPGVRAILTGDGLPLTGEDMRDRPPIAADKVRYYGEVVAVVVADTLAQAEQAARLIRIVYEPLPAVGSPREALKESAPLLHEELGRYEKNKTTYPEPGTNIAHRTKIRKGNINQGFAESDIIIETSVSFAPSDHAAMETRCATAEIWPDGTIHITASSQSPFMIKKLIHTYFGEETGKIIVHTPLVGGAYGGKAPVQLELLAYLAAKAVGGRKVSVWNDRECDMVTSPVHIGLEATVKIGATKDGIFKAMEIVFLFDGGAYSDKAIDVSRAAAVDCTGPYHVEHVWCDSLCVYTNRPYATPFRSFGHCEQSFAIERAIDELAKALQLDPWDVRRKNAIRPGHTTPTQVRLTKSNVGDMPACLDRLRELMSWDEWQRVELDAYTVRAKGISGGWKTSTIDTDANSGVILTFNSDGSVNVISGVVEIGTGTKTVLAQIVAERLKMNVDDVHVKMDIDTQTTPEHWKTVASRGTFMAGRAALAAADDAIHQLKEIAACVLRAAPADLEVGFGRVFLRDDPAVFIPVKDIAYGYKFPNGNAIGGQVIGRGHYILRHLTPLDPETGAGKPGPEWGVCAEGVEVEFNRRDYTYRIVKAYAVIDAGKVLNPKAALGQAMGAMSMGLSFASREGFLFDQEQRVLNPQLRTYRPIRFGEHPTYIVEFVETPQIDAPYGARGIGEHGLIGMPAALANALSLAVGVPLNELPLIPELIWRKQKEA